MSKRKGNNRKGVAMGHSSIDRRATPPEKYTHAQMKKDVERGWKYFWSKANRAHLKPESY